jgi:hypothetical protein
VRDQISHPYKTIGKTTVLYTLIFVFLDSNLEDKRFCCEWIVADRLSNKMHEVGTPDSSMVTHTYVAACSLNNKRIGNQFSDIKSWHNDISITPNTRFLSAWPSGYTHRLHVAVICN